MATIIYDRLEDLFLLKEGDDYSIMDCRCNLRFRKNGYPTRKNYLFENLNGICEYGEDPCWELTYIKAAQGRYFFDAKKITEGYVVTQDDVIREIGQIVIA